LAFAVMGKRSAEAYRAIATKLDEEWKKIDGYQVNRIHVDFEPPEIKGMSDVFGKDKMYGCIVHYVRSIIRYLKTHCPNVFKIYNSQKHGVIHRWVFFAYIGK
jgi:hypothetical protein